MANITGTSKNVFHNLFFASIELVMDSCFQYTGVASSLTEKRQRQKNKPLTNFKLVTAAKRRSHWIEKKGTNNVNKWKAWKGSNGIMRAKRKQVVSEIWLFDKMACLNSINGYVKENFHHCKKDTFLKPLETWQPLPPPDAQEPNSTALYSGLKKFTPISNFITRDYGWFPPSILVFWCDLIEPTPR